MKRREREKHYLNYVLRNGGYVCEIRKNIVDERKWLYIYTCICVYT